VKIRNLTAEDVKIRVMGDFAIITGAPVHDTRGPTGLRTLQRLLGQAERRWLASPRMCRGEFASSLRGRGEASKPGIFFAVFP